MDFSAKNLWNILCIPFFAWIVASCDLGYGVAGASQDSTALIREAEAFTGFWDQRYIEEVTINAPCGDIAWVGADRKLQGFDAVFNTDEKAVFANQAFSLTADGHLKIAVDGYERIARPLPGVFQGRGWHIGFSGSGKYLLVLIRSRAATAKYYVLLASLAGDVLYERVLEKSEVYGAIESTGNAIHINGKCGVRKVWIRTGWPGTKL